MIIPVDTENVFDKIQHPLMIKMLSKLAIKGNILNLIKGIYRKLAANIIFSGEKLNVFSLRLGSRHRCPLYSYSTSH